MNLTAGSHTLVLSDYNNKTTEALEWVEVFFDDVSVAREHVSWSPNLLA